MTKREEKERERQREEYEQGELRHFFRDFYPMIFSKVSVIKRTKKDRDKQKLEALLGMVEKRQVVARTLKVRSSAVMEFVSKQLLLLRHI